MRPSDENSALSTDPFAFTTISVDIPYVLSNREKAEAGTEEEQEDEAKDKKSFKPTKISDAIAEGPEDEEERSEDDVDHFSDDEEAQVKRYFLSPLLHPYDPAP